MNVEQCRRQQGRLRDCQRSRAPHAFCNHHGADRPPPQSAARLRHWTAKPTLNQRRHCIVQRDLLKLPHTTYFGEVPGVSVIPRATLRAVTGQHVVSRFRGGRGGTETPTPGPAASPSSGSTARCIGLQRAFPSRRPARTVSILRPPVDSQTAVARAKST
jgi:hypothetical protein